MESASAYNLHKLGRRSSIATRSDECYAPGRCARAGDGRQSADALLRVASARVHRNSSRHTVVKAPIHATLWGTGVHTVKTVKNQLGDCVFDVAVRP